MRLLLTPAAQLDLSDIWDFTVERWNADQAEDYTVLIRDALNELLAGRRTSRTADDIIPGYRKCQIGSHIAFYRTADDTLIVVRILHQQMDPTLHLRPD